MIARIRNLLSFGQGAGASPEVIRARFLKLTYLQVGSLLLLSNGLELIFREHGRWYAIPAFLGGIVYFFAPLYLDRIRNPERFAQVNIVLGVFLLIERVLTQEGLASPSSMWFLIFPIFAQAFSSLRFTVLITFLSVVGVIATATLQHWDVFNLSQLHGTTPFWIHIVIAVCALYLIAYFGFYGSLVEAHVDDLQKKHLEQETETSVNAVLRDLCRSVVHQVRTPLATLSLSAELLESKLGQSVSFSQLAACESRISKVLEALLFITESVDDDTYEPAVIEGVVKRALEAFRATTHIPSFQYEITVAEPDLVYLVPPIRFAKTLWRIARILEPVLVTSTLPTLHVYLSPSHWGLELRMEIAGLPPHFISRTLLTDIETQATRARAGLLADSGTVSVMSTASGTLLVLLILGRPAGIGENLQ